MVGPIVAFHNILNGSKTVEFENDSLLPQTKTKETSKMYMFKILFISR